ncbi:MAG: hypothetical protein OXH07_00520 [Chloroflexi bacterium]|nr:hypothetical protein [Chloroflexota bacterium]
MGSDPEEIHPEPITQDGEIVLSKDDKGGVTVEVASGPFPPPTMLRGYTDLYPDAPEWFFSRADIERDHRHRIDVANMTLAQSEMKISHREVIFALAMRHLPSSLLAVAAISAAIAESHWAIPVSLGGGVPLTSIFIEYVSRGPTNAGTEEEGD